MDVFENKDEHNESNNQSPTASTTTTRRASIIPTPSVTCTPSNETWNWNPLEATYNPYYRLSLPTLCGGFSLEDVEANHDDIPPPSCKQENADFLRSENKLVVQPGTSEYRYDEFTGLKLFEVGEDVLKNRDFDYISKSYRSVFSVPASFLLDNKNISPFISPEFCYRGVKWSCMVYPKGFSKNSDTDIDVFIQIESYNVKADESVIFKISVLDPDSDRQFTKTSKVYHLNDIRDTFDEGEELKFTRFLYKPYAKLIWRDTGVIKFHIEMIHRYDLSSHGFEQLQYFLQWVHVVVSHGKEPGKEMILSTARQVLVAVYVAHYRLYELGFTGMHYVSHFYQIMQAIQEKFVSQLEDINISINAATTTTSVDFV